jgi:tetratricopeptide (TPR) repeat protein
VRANVYEAKGDYHRALSDYNEALRRAPRDAFIWNNAAWLRIQMKDYDKALSNAEQAIRLSPKLPVAYRNRAVAYGKKGDCKQALASFDQAIKLAPAESAGYSGRGWFLATSAFEECRDAAEALRFAKRGCELSAWKDVWDLRAFAAANAESGDFQEAVKYVRRALELANANDRKDLEKELELYLSGKPFHEE